MNRRGFSGLCEVVLIDGRPVPVSEVVVRMPAAGGKTANNVAAFMQAMRLRLPVVSTGGILLRKIISSIDGIQTAIDK